MRRDAGPDTGRGPSGAPIRPRQWSKSDVSEHVDLLPAPFVLHECVADGCRRPAFGARCDEHQTDEDCERVRALDVALLEAVDAEERWRQARLQVADAERAAGVRRRRLA